jgi:hypothetical protein
LLGGGKTTERLLVRISIETHKMSPDYDQTAADNAKNRIKQALGEIGCDVFTENGPITLRLTLVFGDISLQEVMAICFISLKIFISAVGETEMIADPKRKPYQDDDDSNILRCQARRCGNEMKNPDVFSPTESIYGTMPEGDAPANAFHASSMKAAALTALTAKMTAKSASLRTPLNLPIPRTVARQAGCSFAT